MIYQWVTVQWPTCANKDPIITPQSALSDPLMKVCVGGSLEHGMLHDPWNMHTEKYFRNLIKSTRNQIVFTIFRFIWIQTNVHFIPN